MKKDIIYGFITVRTSSTRLPNKCLLPLGNDSVLEHVIKRCLRYDIEPIVCTTSHSGDDVIKEISDKIRKKDPFFWLDKFFMLLTLSKNFLQD